MKNVKKYLLIISIILLSLPMYYFPDLDIILLGIKYHRYFLFHSVILPILLLIIISKFNNRLFHILLSAFFLAISIHLCIDSFQSKSVVFPFRNTLIYGTSIDDRLWEIVNSILSLILSKHCFNRVYLKNITRNS